MNTEAFSFNHLGEQYGATTLGLLLVLLLLLALWRRWRGQSMRIITVIDGDTLVAVTHRGKKLRLRLRGIDCPELDQPLGPQARQAAGELVAKQWLRVRLHGKDRYDRYVADVWTADGQALQELLVRQGLAHVLPNSPWSWRRAQWGARLRRRGVHGWGHTAPWEHRRKKSIFSKLWRAISSRKPRRY